MGDKKKSQWKWSQKVKIVKLMASLEEIKIRRIVFFGEKKKSQIFWLFGSG